MVLVIRDLLRPWRESLTWWRLTHLVLGVFIGIATFTLMVVLLALSVSLLITFPLALPFVWALFVVARGIGHVERSRYAALLGVEMVDPVPPLRETSLWRRLVERVKTRPRWREIVYGVVQLPVSLLTMLPTVAAWCGSAALLALPLYVSHMPGGTAKFWLFEVSQGAASALAALVGAVGLVFVAPWVTHAMAAIDIAVGRRLLSLPPRRRSTVAWRSSRPAGRRPWTAPRPSGGASSATCTMAPSSGWWRWPWTWATPASGSRSTQRAGARWWRRPTRRPRPH